MDLPRRDPGDIFLQPGAFQKATEKLRNCHQAHDWNIVIVYAFDFRTRMLPFWYADKRMAPCSVRTLADVLDCSGFKNIRVVLQQWNPNFKPSRAELGGKPIDILMTSAMQVHAEPSWDLIRDAHTLGEHRPLILSGGPKAIYEPTDYFELGPEPGVGTDCVVTGEVYILLRLLQAIIDHRRDGDSPLTAFERARSSRGLDDVAGLVYLSPASPSGKPYAVNTGVQQLLQNLDELPIPDAGYRVLEPPHRKETLSPDPCPAQRVGKLSIISSIIATQGCKFNCSFCPIPAFNQRSWRHKSANRMAAEIKHIYEKFGIREFFGTDDNFFNKRKTVVDFMTAMVNTQTSKGTPLGKEIRFYTEGTQSDVFKNRDILPLCREGGMKAIWFGIEDITGELVNKGQNESKTEELFTLLNKIDIETSVMMIHSDDQPLRSKPGNLSGLINQARYVFDKGATSYQVTYLGPAVGSSDIDVAAQDRIMFEKVGGQPVPQTHQDGNYVMASRHPQPWKKQTNLIRGYAAFYNPFNILKILLRYRRDKLAGKRLMFQAIGHIGLLLTAPRMYLWARKLKRGPIKTWEGMQKRRIPMVDIADGCQSDWAIRHLPADYLPVRGAPVADNQCIIQLR